MGHQTTEGRDTATGSEVGTETSTTWYQSPAVVAVLAVDVALVLVVAAGTTVLFRGLLPASLLATLDSSAAMSVTVPWEVYAFGLLGAFGFVFTALVREFDRTPLRVVQYHVRVPAAIPLAAGVYLLAGLILGDGSGGTRANDTLVAGLAFVSGLYVNLAYERLSALADRLLPNRLDADEDDDEGDDETSTDGNDTSSSEG